MQYSPNAIDQAAKKIWSDKDIYKVENDISKPKHYVLEMFPYPSGAGLHVGHPLGYVAGDIYARFKRMKGFNVLHPMGFDSFGLPAEQYAIETGKDPRDTTRENIETYKKQFDKIGLSFDWSREVVTSSPEYYKWTQWLFIEMFNSIYCCENQSAYSVNVLIKHFEEHGNHNNTAFTNNHVKAFSAEEWKAYTEKEKSDILMNYSLIYTSMGEVNWCEALGTVLANDEVINGRSERGNHPVVKKKMRQWSLRMTAYADRLLQGLDEIGFSNSLKDQQRNWIGKSTGAIVTFPLSPSKGRGVPRHATANPATASILYQNAKENRKKATEAEKKLWNEIRNRKLEYKFRRQHPIDNYIADFICLEQNLIIEVDGGYHTQTKEYDDARTAVLNELGYRVIRFTNEEVINDIKNVLSKLKSEFSAPSTLLQRGEGPGLRVFTTRPDTIFGATFMVLAPEHSMVSEIVTDEYKTKVNDYIAYCKSKSDIDRQAEKEVSGQFTGAYALHPFTGKMLPIYIAEYVLMGYGTGAIMAVPAEDERDRKFAEKFGIEIVEIFDKAGIEKTEVGDKQGVLKNSDFINGLTWKEGFDKVIEAMEYDEIGERKTQFRLRDANFSRQRYWGEPIPILWKDDVPYPLETSQLPLLNPDVDSFLPSKDGLAPNARNQEWVNKVEGYTREVDTMPAFAGSSWYFLRYMDPQNDGEFVAKDLVNYWGQVDLYQGGSEHAVGHLLYARYFNHFLYDRGYISHKEPFKRLINQGMIQGVSAFVYSFIFKIDIESWGYKGCENLNPPLIYISYDLVKELELEFKQKNYSLVKGEIKDCKISKFKFKVNDELFNWEEDEELNEKLLKVFQSISFDPLFFDIDFRTVFHSPRTDINNIDELTDELNLEKHRKWRNEYSNAEFIANSNGKFIVGREVEKMSKSKYNVHTPDDVIDKYGADCFRMYEMFLGPIEQSKPWNTAGIEGVSKFLRRFWNLYFDENGHSKLTKNDATEDELKVLHRTIDKLGKDIENFSFNTSVSALMIALNEFNALKTTSESVLIPLLKSICPFAPHTAETIWSRLGNNSSIIVEEFPSVDEKYLVDDTIEYPVSINGKMRAKVSLAADADETAAKETALSNETVIKWLEGKEIKKFIFVQGRMINVVI
jgi:leucyl-tRNA synthetase